MKNSPKTKTKKPTSLKAFAQLSTTQKRVVVLILAVLLLILGTWLWHTVSVRSDKARFVEADQTKTEVVYSLADKMTGVVSIDHVKYCRHAERGPYGSGKLWCSTVSGIYLSSEISESQVATYVNDVVYVSGLIKTNVRISEYEFEGGHSLPCEIMTYEGSSATKPGNYLPDHSTAKQLIVIECSDRAKAAHYPMVD